MSQRPTVSEAEIYSTAEWLKANRNHPEYANVRRELSAVVDAVPKDGGPETATEFGRIVYSKDSRRFDHEWLRGELENWEKGGGDRSPTAQLRMPELPADVPSSEQVFQAMGDAPAEMPVASPADQPSPLLTLDELEEAERKAAEEERAGFFTLMGKGFKLDTSIGAALDWMDGTKYFYDRDFDGQAYAQTPDVKARIDALQGADMEEVGSLLGEALNQDHFDDLLKRIERDRDDEQMLAEAGAKGFVARMAGALLDPVDLAITAIAAPVGVPAKLGKLGLAVKGALAAGASSASIEAMAAARNPYRGATDVAFAAAAGLTLGGALGSLSRADNARIGKIADDIVREDMDARAAALVDSVPAADGSVRTPPPVAPTPPPPNLERVALMKQRAEAEVEVEQARAEWDAYVSSVVDEAPDEAHETRLLLDEAIERLNDIDNEIATLDPDLGTSSATGDSVGASRRVLEGDAPLDPPDTSFGADIDKPKYAWGWTQWLQHNYVSRLLHSANDLTRGYASRIIEGGFMADKNAARQHTAEGVARNLHHTYTTRFYRETTADFNAWAKKNGVGTFRRTFGSNTGAQFYEEVGMALRGATDRISPEARSAAAKVRKMLDEYHALAQEVGLPGFMDAERLGNFFPRTWAKGKLSELRKSIGFNDNVLGMWFQEAIMDAQEDIAEDVAAKLGMGFARALKARAEGLEDVLNHGLDLSDVNRLRDQLGPDFEGLDEIIAAVDASNKAKGNKQGKVRHGKQRLNFNELAARDIRLEDGTTRRLGIEDLTISDARKVIPRYFQTMGGHIALAKTAGIRSEGDVRELLKQMAASGATENERNAMQDVLNLVRGISVEDDPYSGVSQLSRVAAAWDFSRFGGQFGFAQIAELGNILGQAGIMTFMRNIPLYKDFMRRALDGRLPEGIAREIDEIIAPGTDFIRNPAVTSFDEQGLGFDTSTFLGRALDKVDAPLQRVSRFTQAISLMAPITAGLERIASYEIAHQWARAARGTGKVSTSRLRAAGLSARDQKTVFNAMNKFAKFDGKRLKSLNTHLWDADARDLFILALDRERSFTIQRNLIGNTGRYIHSPLGRMLTRFMTFTLNSVNQQLLRGIRHNDIQTYVSWSYSTFIASIVYIAQTNIDYANDDKRRKERLQPGRIAAAAFQRAGFASMVVPITDNALALGGFDPIFAHGRQTGLGTNLVTGNTTITGLQDLYYTAGLPFRLLHDDYDFSQQDLQRIQRLLVLQRVAGLKNAFHAIEEDLPRESQDR